MDFNKQNVDDLATQLAEEIVVGKAHDPSKSLLPAHAESERIKGDVLTSLNSHFLSVANGLDLLLDRLETMLDADSPLVDPQAYEELLQKLSTSGAAGEEGLFALSDQELKILLAAAIDLYNQQEFNQAGDAFYVLTVFEPTRPLFWKCLGNAKFFDKKFKEAHDAYEMAIKIDPHDPECYIYLARCLQNEGREREAIDKLQQATDLIGQDPHFASWKEQVTLFTEELKKNK